MTTTFSQMADELARELVRPDFLTSGLIPALINQTVREMYTGSTAGPTPGRVIRFTDDLVEAVITPDTDNVYNWTIPNLMTYQSTGEVYYPRVQREAMQTTPIERRSGDRSPIGEEFNFYRSGPVLVFRGFGSAGNEIWYSGFWYVRSLVYRPESTRWASYDLETDQWSYLPDSGKPPEEAQLLSTNWIIQRWTDTIKEGVRAKAFKRLGDEVRSRSSYSLFENQRFAMQQQETWPGGHVFAR